MKCDVCGKSIVLSDLDSYHFSDSNDHLNAKCILCVNKENNKYFFPSIAIVAIAFLLLFTSFILNNIFFCFLTIILASFLIVLQVSKIVISKSSV